jgi:acyl transferase domain-containing protein
MVDDARRLTDLSAVKLALLARQTRQKLDESGVGAAEPIAVVGMSCRFPGGADDPAKFWELVSGRRDAIREVPADRWPVDTLYDPDPAAPGKMTTRWGGFLDSIDGFDPRFCGISPREAARMDPQQRLLLEVAWEALEDAGQTRAGLDGSPTGVFVASYHNDYARLLTADRREIDAWTSTGTAHSIVANRLSYLLNLRGPSLTVDTACSASLVAVHLACRSLRAEECSLAVAGGVSLMLSPEVTISLSKWGFMAADGRCKTFDAKADGFVRGEGCGVVVLKRLSDALADGDRVLGLIRGTAVNQDGRTTVLTAPSGVAQAAVIRRRWRMARWRRSKSTTSRRTAPGRCWAIRSRSRPWPRCMGSP